MRVKFRAAIATVLVALIFPSFANAQGVYLNGAGAVQGAMGGASTATPLDGIGALYWNPAAIGRLGHNEVSFGGNVLFPSINVSSSLPRGASGSTDSDNGVGMTSTLGLVYQPDDSRLTYGMGIFTLGGGGVNFPGDPSNPVLAPTGPLGKTVIGPVASSMTLIQLAPSLAYQVTDKLIVGIGPTIDISLASFDPAVFGAPSGTPLTFPSATHSQPFWGGGVRAGFVYSPTEKLDFGFGYTSPQWLQAWTFQSRDQFGNPLTLTLNPTLPAIYSWGVGWRGIDKLTLALDLRYFDYANAQLFGTSVKNGGLGWNSVFSAAVGANYQLTEKLAIRCGYQYNTDPLANTSTLFNIQAPAILQNTVSAGATVNISDALSASVGYAYSFQNSVTGTASEVPGASVKLSASNQSILFNVSIKFGGGWGHSKPCCGPAYDMMTPAPVPASTAPTMTSNQTTSGPQLYPQ
jgi:long-chain fatty acid transport protein